MNSRPSTAALGRTLRIAASVLLVCVLLAPRAHAETLGSPLLQSSTLVAGSSSTVYSFNVNGPGVFTVKLENISWPERLAQLDCSIYSSDGFLQALNGTSEWQFATTGAGTFYANILAGAAGRLGLGLFSIKVTFQSSASLVPVPAAVWLLASVFGLFGARRHVMPALRFTRSPELVA
jgi:hypothetical protein